ncbi:MAG TPA: NAD(P)/FAD-dependent oxidoreductase [Ktedonobacterales bacterium]|nr:NAD(P)/FAD-dependent oxidoreductase [Ktedonobacterales bacterium]
MPRIAIIGAGVAGLTAALTLHDAGLESVVYEAADHVGGRMHSDAETWGDGSVSELCGEFIDSDHTTLHHLINRFNLSTIDLGRGVASQTQSLTYLMGRFYSDDDLAEGFQTVGPTVARHYHDAGFPTTYARSTEPGRALDQMSVYDWIERYIAGGHATAVGHYLDGACTGLFGLDTRTQSALNLIYLFGGRFASQSARSPMQGASKIVDGNQRLPVAIARSLPEGNVRLGHRLVTVERASDDMLDLTFSTANGAARERYDAVILTLPFSALRRVDYQRAGFDARKRAAIEQLGYGTISKLFLQFDTPYWYGDGPWPHDHNGFIVTDLPIQTLWDSEGHRPGASGETVAGRSHALLVDYTSGRHGAAYAPPAPYTTTASAPEIERYAQDCLRELERVFPGVSAHYTGRAALSYPTADPNLLGSYACWRVGQYTAFAGYEGVAQGPIHFAGEHCSIEFQGYMEGAAREGARAAREIIEGAPGA